MTFDPNAFWAVVAIGGILIALWLVGLYSSRADARDKAEAYGQRIADLMVLHPEVAKVFEYTREHSGYDNTMRVKSLGLTINLSLIKRLGEAKRYRHEVTEGDFMLAEYYSDVKERIWASR